MSPTTELSKDKVQRLESASLYLRSCGWYAVVDDIYFDYGQRWLWTTLVIGRSAQDPVETRESRHNSRNATWFPHHPKMRPLPPTASQEKSHVPS